MARTTIPALERMRDGHPLGIRPRAFIETGTLHAETARFAKQLYEVVETIELSETLYRAALRRYTGNGIRFHLGDSGAVLPTILAGYLEPVCIYLDAHWFPRPDVARGTFPLWSELEAVRARPYADIVIVDDVHSFGTPHPGPEWQQVTPARIVDALDRVLASAIQDDHFVVYRGPA
jgi:hypothetical protein